jgi:hypothetical protein
MILRCVAQTSRNITRSNNISLSLCVSNTWHGINVQGPWWAMFIARCATVGFSCILQIRGLQMASCDCCMSAVRWDSCVSAQAAGHPQERCVITTMIVTVNRQPLSWRASESPTWRLQACTIAPTWASTSTWPSYSDWRIYIYIYIYNNNNNNNNIHAYMHIRINVTYMCTHTHTHMFLIATSANSGILTWMFSFIFSKSLYARTCCVFQTRYGTAQ